MNIPYRLLLWPSIVALLLVAPATLCARPPGPVLFEWSGNGYDLNQGTNGDGNGNLSSWQLWHRQPLDPDNPANFFPPQDGDSLRVDHTANGGWDARRTIAINALDLHIDVVFVANADLSGGDLKVNAILIENSPVASVNNPGESVYYTTNFSGTKLQADDFFHVRSFIEPISFTGSTLRADRLQMYGSAQLFQYPGLGVGQTNVLGGSSLEFNTLEVGKTWYLSDPESTLPYVLNVEASTLEGLGIDVSGAYNPLFEVGHTARLQLGNGAQANLDQFVVVGTEARGELILSGGSNLTVASGYLNVGDLGPGFMRVSGNSEVHTADFNIAVFDEGNVAADSGGKIFSTLGIVGVIPGQIGTVNLEDGGRWETDGLTLGALGTGYVFVRQNGTLKIKHEGIIGLNAGSRGVVNLIGSTAKLELDEDATLTIGKEGTGELHLSEGATFTSEGTTVLADVAGGTTIVTVDGQDSQWTVNGNLYIGERGTGIVEINNAGKLTGSGASIFLGTQSTGDGTLTLDGADSQLDFEGELFPGYSGKGKVAVKNGAQFTTGNLTLGFLENSEGKLDVTNISSFKTTGDLVVGREGRGELNVSVFGKLTSEGNVVFGEYASSGTPENANAALVSGFGAEWKVTGDMTVGKQGVGLITVQDQGKLTNSGNVILGDEAESTGEVDLEGDNATQWEVSGNLTIGKHGTGIVDLTRLARLHAKGPLLVIGEEQGSHGTLSVTGGVDEMGSTYSTIANVDGNMRVGVGGTGTLQLIGGDGVGLLKVLGSAAFGLNANGNGKAEVQEGGSFHVLGELTVGGEGRAKIEITQGGHVTVDNQIVIDATAAEHAIVDVRGVTSLPVRASRLSSDVIIVGEFGYGELTLADGGQVRKSNGEHTNHLRLATHPNSHGKLTVSSNAIVNAVNLYAAATNGQGGEAEIILSSQAKIDVTGQVTLGSVAGGKVDLKINSGGQLIAKDIDALNKSITTVSDSGKIVLKSNGKLLMGGTVDHPATLTIQGSGSLTTEQGAAVTQFRPGFHGRSIVNVNSGGTIAVGHIAVGSAGQQAVGGTQVTVSGSSSLIHATSTHDALIVHPGATLTATSGGRIQANGPTGVHGTVNVLGGAMAIGPVGETSAAALGAVTVFPEGVLYGKGTIKGNLIAKNPNEFPGTVTGPRIKLGNSPGLLTVEGDVTIEHGSVLEIEIGGLTAGTDYDVLDVTGNVVIDGTADLQFINGFAPSTGNTFSLINAGSLGGAPDIVVRNLAPGWQYDLSQQGNAWVLTSLSDAVFQLSGDFNGDGFVNAADYVVWRKNAQGNYTPADYDAWYSNFGVNLSGSSNGDFNGDGNVDAADYVVWRKDAGAESGWDYNQWRAQFGQTLGSGAGALHAGGAVPEPATLSIAAFMLFAWTTVFGFRGSRLSA